MTGPACPFCGAAAMPGLGCEACGGTAHDRMVWAAVHGLGLLGRAGPVLHHRPAPALAARLHALLGADYHAAAAGLPPDIPAFAFDLSRDAPRLRAGSYAVIIATRGLAEADAALPALLDAMVAALRPGGSLLFGGDAVGEGGGFSSQAMAAAPGADSFGGFVRRHFGHDCRIRPGRDLPARVLEQAALDLPAQRRIQRDAIFWFQA